MTPDGKEIRVPKFAFEPLRRLGVLERNRAQLKPLIYQLMDPLYDDLVMGLRQLLGPDLSGPNWCVCHCRECQKKATQTDNTSLPGQRFSGFYAGTDTDAIVREVRARRRIAA